MKFKKRVASSLLALILSINALTPTFAASSVYIDSLVEEQQVANGIKYSKIQQLTSAGFVDINLLTVDLTDPNVDFDILRNDARFGYQEKLSTLVGDSTETNVVGAVNGSFFFTDTTPTDVIGYEYEDGEFTFMKENYNKAKLDENSIIISNDNEVTFGYLQANTIIYNSKGESVRAVTLNGSRDLINMTLVTDRMMKDSTRIESLGNVYKWVIEDGVVTDIVPPKTIAQVPENGFLLTVNYNGGENMKRMFPIGEKVNVALTTNFDDILADTKLMMSGAGAILRDGKTVYDGLSVTPTLRNPRTFVGVSQDGNTMYIGAVDGRGTSIGMTHDETANFLKSIGAYNAINLDGGGSTTFAVREEGETQAKVVNTPSDGTERKVINGLGVVTTPTGQLDKLIITASSDKALTGQPVKFSVRGVDSNGNPMPIDTSKVTLTDTANVNNVSTNGTLTFTSPGITIVEADYNGIKGQFPIDVYSPEQVNFDIKPISVDLKGSEKIELTATTSNGSKIPLDPSVYTFTPNANFHITNGILYGNGAKTQGSFTTTIGNKTVTGKAAVGASDIYVPLTSFEGSKVASKPYPNGNEGATGVYKEMPLSGQYAIKTSFNFKASGKPQAVYSILSGVNITDSRAEKLCVNYYGQNKGNSVKAQITDAKGKERIVVFTNAVDFNGYKRLEADLPDGLVYPVSVDRLYVASTGAKAMSGVGYFDYLTYTIGDSFIAGLNNINLVYDPLNRKTNTQELFGVAQKPNNAITKTYTSTVLDDTKIINVSADNGSIALTDANFYNKLKNELYTSSQKNIVVVTSQSIIDNSFAISQEGVMLKNMLEEYASKYDKNIYYVNNHSNENSTTFENNIRYIDLYNQYLSFALDENKNLTYKTK